MDESEKNESQKNKESQGIKTQYRGRFYRNPKCGFVSYFVCALRHNEGSNTNTSRCSRVRRNRTCASNALLFEWRKCAKKNTTTKTTHKCRRPNANVSRMCVFFFGGTWTHCTVLSSDCVLLCMLFCCLSPFNQHLFIIWRFSSVELIKTARKR